MNPIGIIGDIGGTNARFALVDSEGNIGEAERVETIDHEGLQQGLAACLERLGLENAPASCALALAGPVGADQEAVRLTNCPWVVSKTDLARVFGFSTVHLVNDFTAVALGVPHLKEADWISIGGGQAVPEAPIGVIGPGTGLGVSALIRAGGNWTALATEGGHVTLPASDDREATVITELRKQGHVSAEKLLSGQGLVTLAETLGFLDGKSAGHLGTPAAVTGAALSGRDDLAAETLDLFLAFLGTVAADLALSLGAKGGVYLAGGILPRFPETVRNSRFRQRFEDKGRFGSYLAEIPTRLVLHPHPAFLGLAGLLR